MHKVRSRLAALLAVLALTVGALFTATPAFAAGADGKITVTSTNPEFKYKTITVYQMFNETGDDGSEQYVLVEAWKSFFTTEIGEGGIGLPNDDNLSDAAYTYVKNLGETNDQAVSDFAKKAAAWAENQAHGITGTVSAGATDPDGTGTYTAQVTGLTGLNYGYYLVVPETGSTPSTEEPYANRGTDAMLVNVNSAQGATQELKSVYPTLTKQVENESGADSTPGDHASAQVGDTLTFTLTSTIPDMTEYNNNYSFIFHDTLSTGLTFQKGSVEVWVNGSKLDNAGNADFTVIEPAGEDGGELTVTMNDFKTRQQANAGKEIKVVYKATLNKNAVTDDVTTATTNDAYLEYSNDPSTGGTGHTYHDKVYVYDFKFTINKTDGTNPLDGAKFTLKDNAQPANNINLIQVQAGDDTNPAIYRVAEAGESSTTTNVVTPESGKVIIRGLEAGTYKLTETDAPEGYNKVEGDITVTITATYNEDGTLASWKVNEDGTNHEVEVVNHAGAILPGTGGMGTVIFTVVGIAIVAGGVLWFTRRNKALG